MAFGRNLRLAALAFMLWSLAYNLIAPLLPLLARELGATPTGMGMVGTAGTLGAVVLVFPISFLSDTAGRRTALLAGWATSAAGVLLIWPARTWCAMLPGAFLSMAAAAALPTLNALAIDELPPHVRTRGFSLLYGAAPVGALCGAALGGVLCTHLGLRTTTAIAGVSLLLAVAALLPMDRLKPAIPLASSAPVPRSQQGGLLKLLFACVAAGGFLLVALPGSFVVPYLKEEAHWNLVATGLLTALLSGAQASWSFLFSVWPRDKGRVRLGSGPGALTFPLSTLQAICTCLAANALFGWLLPVAMPGATVVALLLRGSQFTLQALGSALLGDVVTRSARLTTQLTGFSAILGFGAAAAPIAGGWLYGLAPTAPFLVSGTAAAGGALILLIAMQKLPRADQPLTLPVSGGVLP